MTIMVTVAVHDGAAWRIALIVTLTIFVFGWSAYELAAFRQHRMTALAMPRNLALLGAVQIVTLFGLGGIECPLLPVVMPLMILVAMFGSPRLSTAVAFCQVASIWGFAAMRLRGLMPDQLPRLFGGRLTSPTDPDRFVVTAILMTAVIVVGRLIGRSLRAWIDDGIRSTVAARDEALRAYAEQARTLTALSAEIAHELKNPLASVKGLAALVARDVDGKPEERMQVLRREVDRMQSILDEFLNFSRPLVPLSIAEVDLATLADEAAVLHEGVAREKKVALHARSSGPVAARCDCRKVKQILVNLLQNALDASPAGSEIVLEVDVSPAGAARIVVRDQGAGLADDVLSSAFEPGVTTKAGGSGLGLTIARGLARQHGGDLALHAAVGAGCEAVLTLPTSGPPHAESVAMPVGELAPEAS
jgi:signal transduction histidine kinase